MEFALIIGIAAGMGSYFGSVARGKPKAPVEAPAQAGQVQEAPAPKLSPPATGPK